MLKQNHYVPVRLSDKEFRRLENLAKRSKVSRSEILRRGIMGLKIYEAPKVIDAEFHYQLARIGDNINQIAKKANESGVVNFGWFEIEFENLRRKVGEACGDTENKSKEIELETVN